MSVLPGPRTRSQLAAVIQPHGRLLLGLSYRMLGSVEQAEASLARTEQAAWKARAELANRPDAAAWLAQIAVRDCIEQSEQERQHRNVLTVPLPREASVCVAAQAPWVQPLPDTPDGGVDLATAVGLQHLSPIQRACVVLRYTLGWSNAQTAEALGLSSFGAHSTTQRGRDALRARTGKPHDAPTQSGLSDGDREAVLGYCRAIESGDMREIAGVLRHDVIVTHQPGAAGSSTDQPAVYLGEDAVLQSWAPLMSPEPHVRMRMEVIGSAGGRPVVLASLLDAGDAAPVPFALEVLAMHGERVAELANFSPALARYFS